MIVKLYHSDMILEAALLIVAVRMLPLRASLITWKVPGAVSR